MVARSQWRVEIGTWPERGAKAKSIGAMTLPTNAHSKITPNRFNLFLHNCFLNCQFNFKFININHNNMEITHTGAQELNRTIDKLW